MKTRTLRFAVTATVMLCAALVLAGCAMGGMKRGGSSTYREPGLYSCMGWNSSSVYFSPGQDGTAGDIDVNGEVGFPLTVWGPTASVEPQGTGWSCSGFDITSGTLPPGLSMGSDGRITGIPGERGHWIVTLQVTNPHVGETTYHSWHQQVRFHITGSGKVNN
jgi:hypothetical protein